MYLCIIHFMGKVPNPLSLDLIYHCGHIYLLISLFRIINFLIYFSNRYVYTYHTAEVCRLKKQII